MPNKRMYSVVAFPDTNQVDSIPSIWLCDNKSKCFWPPVRCATSYVEKYRQPEDSWEKHNVKVLKEYDTLLKARQKSNVAQDTDDLATCDERKKKKRKHVSSSSSSSSDHETDDNDDEAGKRISSMKKPPSTKLFNSVLDGKETTKNRKVKSNHTTKKHRSPIQSSSSSYQQKQPNNNEKSLSSMKNRKTRSSPPSKPRRSLSPSCSVSSQDYLCLSPSVDADAPVHRCCISESSVKSIISGQEKILAIVRLLGSDIQAVMRTTASTNLPEPPYSGPKLSIPMKTMEEFKKAEKQLKKSEDVRNWLVELINRTGGSDAGDCIRTVLEKLLEFSLGKTFSWAGRRGSNKEKFKGTKLSKIIQCTVAELYKKNDETEHTIGKRIQEALKHRKANLSDASDNSEDDDSGSKIDEDNDTP